MVKKNLPCLFFILQSLIQTTLWCDPVIAVLTGGPGSGKSTTINWLSNNNFKTLPEGATIVIQKSKNRGINEPWLDLDSFSREILEVQISKIKEIQNLSNNEIVFSDRGIPDAWAYYNLENREPIQELTFHAKTIKYDIIFFLDFLKENYRLNGIRHESIEEALKIHEELRKVYENLGYKIISVPVMSIEERGKFILEEIKKIKSITRKEIHDKYFVTK